MTCKATGRPAWVGRDSLVNMTHISWFTSTGRARRAEELSQVKALATGETQGAGSVVCGDKKGVVNSL